MFGNNFQAIYDKMTKSFFACIPIIIMEYCVIRVQNDDRWGVEGNILQTIFFLIKANLFLCLFVFMMIWVNLTLLSFLCRKQDK